MESDVKGAIVSAETDPLTLKRQVTNGAPAGCLLARL